MLGQISLKYLESGMVVICKLKSRCGAKTRKGTPCKRMALANGRCPNHGGLSTGPVTTEGRRRALANLKQYRVNNVQV